MMMDSVQTASSTQPTEELTDLGKCLLKHEVRLITYCRGHNCYPLQALYELKGSLFFFNWSEHLHEPVDPFLHLAIMEGRHQLSPHRFDGLLDTSAAGTYCPNCPFTVKMFNRSFCRRCVKLVFIV